VRRAPGAWCWPWGEVAGTWAGREEAAWGLAVALGGAPETWAGREEAARGLAVALGGRSPEPGRAVSEDVWDVGAGVMEARWALGSGEVEPALEPGIWR
jgi:hypothetical protein